jgi:RHS repeat-associated protein
MRTIGRNPVTGALMLAVCGLVASIPASAVRRSAAPPPVRQDWGEGGQTTTRLADGRTLVVGGQTARGISPVARIVETGGGARDVALPQARAWHTATVLPDGRVLITGGLGAGGQILGTADAFDPMTSTFATVSVSSAAARMGHSTTLLSDGRLLVVGGEAADGTPASAEVWTLTGTGVVVVPLGGGAGRTRHTATLMPDGRVLVAGGRDSAGRARTDAEIFDPTTGRFERSGVFDPDERPARLSGSRPDDGATDVPLDARIALRFSSPVAVAMLSSTTATLSSEDGPVSVAIVPAEGGRLLILRPASPLSAQTRYVAAVRDLRDDHGAAVRNASVSFTTASDDRTAATDDPDGERWVPDAHDREGDGWRTGRANSSWQDLAPLLAEPGTTAVSGQVLRLDGKPLAGVTMAMAGQDVETDRTGRFLLPLPAVSPGHQELEIKGETANRGTRRYGYFEYGMEIAAGRTTVVPFTIWMPLLDTAHEVTIASPTLSETVITTPYIPGLELHLPAGTTITDEVGKVVRKVSITPIPVDRPPFPLARNVDVPVYFTVQPGGAYVSTAGTGLKGAWLVYPNYRHEWTGKRIQFFHYDPEVRGWYVYGLGTVTPDARQVTPDPRTRIYTFTGAMINGGSSPASETLPPGECRARSCAGDPVNLTTGLFTLDETDVILSDVLPIALTRTYRTRDVDVRPFGVGTTHPYAMFLWSAHQYTEADLILPDGGRIHYVRTSAGTGWADAVFEHVERLNPPPGESATSATPTDFYRSIMRWNGNGWDVTLKDGTVYVFGENAPLQEIRDQFGNTITIAHQNGQYGPVSRVTSPHGRWIEFTYTSGVITQVKDNAGRTWTYTYDAFNNLWKVTDPLSHMTERTYDSAHRLLTITNRNNVVYVTNEYFTDPGSNQGWVKKQTYADGGVFQFAYTIANGRSTQTDITNPRGAIRRATFNADGYSLTDTRALGQMEEQTVTAEREPGSNFVAAVVDGLNRRSEFVYDTSGDLLSATRLAGTVGAVTTTLAHEPRFHQVASITDPMNHTWTFTHDSAGALTGITDPLSHHTTVATDSSGEVTSITDPLSHTWQFGYLGGDITMTTNPLGAIRRRLSDAAGREVAIVDPLGRSSISIVDASNRLITTTDAAGGQTSFTYDAEGNVLSQTDALSHQMMYTHDSSDRLATMTDPLGHVSFFEYDVHSNLLRVTDRKGQATELEYDALDRPVRIRFHDTSTITYIYDAGNRLTNVLDSLNGTLTRAYDDLDRLIEEDTPDGALSYTYDADGLRSTMTVVGQPAVYYAYDDTHRITTLTQGTDAVAFTYDEANRRSTVTYPNGILATLAYDNANRLTGIAYTHGATAVGNLSYTYDLAGRKIGVAGTWARSALPPPMTAATYDAANRLVARNGTNLTYDLNGNLASDGGTSYIWNTRDQLVGLSGDVSAAFAYDGVSRRRSESVGGTTTRFLYDRLNLVQELTGGGLPSANLLTGLSVDETFMRTDINGTSVLLVDGLGSTVALVNSSGTVGTQYTYDPFGAATSTGSASSNRAQYVGRENTGVGLHYYRARFYTPSVGRFISEDPLGYVDGPNLYAYVQNSPTNFKDAMGLQYDSVSRSLLEAIKRGDIAEIENILESSGDVLSAELKEAARAAIKRLRSKVKDIIAKECKGSVNTEFPDELRERTLEEVMKLAKQGNAAARKALKLLNDLRFKK